MHLIRCLLLACVLAVVGLVGGGGGVAEADTGGDQASYVYDSQGRLVSATYANGVVITYSYDAEGNRTSVVTVCPGGNCATISGGSGAYLILAATLGNASAMNVTGPATTGTPVTVSLINAGDVASSVVSVSISSPINFALTGGTCLSGSTTLAAGASCTLQVTPEATGNGSYSGTLSIAANNNPLLALSGTASGFAAAAALPVLAPVAFGSVASGTALALPALAASGGAGGPYTYALGSVSPAASWLSLSTNGVLNGIPPSGVNQTYLFAVTVTDAAGGATTTSGFTLSVGAGSRGLSAMNIAVGTLASAYSTAAMSPQNTGLSATITAGTSGSRFRIQMQIPYITKINTGDVHYTLFRSINGGVATNIAGGVNFLKTQSINGSWTSLYDVCTIDAPNVTVGQTVQYTVYLWVNDAGAMTLAAPATVTVEELN